MFQAAVLLKPLSLEEPSYSKQPSMSLKPPLLEVPSYCKQPSSSLNPPSSISISYDDNYDYDDSDYDSEDSNDDDDHTLDDDDEFDADELLKNIRGECILIVKLSTQATLMIFYLMKQFNHKFRSTKDSI